MKVGITMHKLFLISLMLFTTLIVGCNSKPTAIPPKDNRVVSIVTNDEIEAKVLQIKNDEWNICGKKVKGTRAWVILKDLNGRKITSDQFTYVVPATAEDNLGNKYEGSTTIDRNDKLSKSFNSPEAFMIIAEFIPPLSTEATKLSFNIKMQPNYKISETVIENITFNNINTKKFPGFYLEKFKGNSFDPELTDVYLIQNAKDYSTRQLGQDSFLISEDGKKYSARSYGTSDPLNKAGDIRDQLSFSKVPKDKKFTLVIAWQLPNVTWEFSFKNLDLKKLSKNIKID